MIRVFVWNEFDNEKRYEKVRQVYPKGIHHVIAGFLEEDEAFEVLTGTLEEPAHGLPDEVLDTIDVLIWWGHSRHQDVSDDLAVRIQKRVHDGMGFIALHSAHMAKPFGAMTIGSGSGISYHSIPSPPASRSRLRLSRRRCTVSSSTSPHRTSSSSSAGSQVARSSGLAVPGSAAPARSSTSSRVTRNIRSTIRPRFRGSSAMLCTGPSRLTGIAESAPPTARSLQRHADSRLKIADR